MPPKSFPYIKDGTYKEGDVPINFFMRPDPVKGEVLYRTWGLKEHCDVTDCSEGRGIYAWNGILYAVIARGSYSILWSIDPASGAFSELGTMTTSFTGPVWMIDNGVQLGISDGVTMYTYTPSTGLFLQNTDSAFPGSSALDYVSGLGIYVTPNSNQWGFTGLYDFTDIDALDFYSFESKTGNIVSLVIKNLEPYILAEKGTEVWFFYGGDNSDSNNPTFARNTNGTIDFGCGAIGTPNIADGMIVNWLSDKGQWIMASGYDAKVISPQIMDDAVKDMALFSDARCFSWRDSGHVFTAMTFPTGKQTWVRDWTTQMTFKMSSYITGSQEWGRHRLSCLCKLGNDWFGLDYENGKVYKFSRSYYDDAGHAIRRVLHTINFDGGSSDIDFGEMALMMKMGIGNTGDVTAPQVMMSWSRDSGKTWSSELWRSAGFIGEYKIPPPTWNRNGQSRRRMWRFAFTDPVDWQIHGLDLQMQVLQG